MSTPESQNAEASPQLSKGVTQSEKSLGATTEMSEAGETPWTDDVTFLAIPELANGEKEECVTAFDARMLERDRNQLRSKVSSLEQDVERLTGAMSWSEAKTEEENVALRARVKELEQENERLKGHHQRDEDMIVQRTDEIRALNVELAAYKDGAATLRSKLSALLAQVEELKKQSENYKTALLSLRKEYNDTILRRIVDAVIPPPKA